MAKKEQEDVIEHFFPVAATGMISTVTTSPDQTSAIAAQTTTETTQQTTQQTQNFVQRIKEFIETKAKWIEKKTQWMRDYAQKAMQFAGWLRTIALFFPLIIVARMIIGFFQKPLEFIMLGFACIFLAIAYVIYFILSIPPFIIIPFLIWFFIMDILPLLVYSVVMVALFVAITVICIIIAGINAMTGGSLKNLVLCQNPAAAWYKTPNFHLSNKFERGVFCSRQCYPGYYPDTTGMFCVKVPKGQPSYCPQAEIMRLYTGTKNDRNYYFKDFQTKGNLNYMKQSPENREIMIKNHLLKKRDFLEKCNTSMSKYNYMPLSICSSLDVIEKNNINGIDKKTLNKMKKVCSQAFCDSRSNYPFCSQLDGTGEEDDSEFWKKVMKVLILIAVFVFVIMFTLGYITGATMKME